MKQRALVPTFFALALMAGSILAVAPGCDGEVTTGDPTGGGGGTTSTTGGAGGTTTTTTGANPLCDQLCFHLTDINCNVVSNCKSDCENHLGAPEECIDKADALIACWVEHLDDFQCTQTQVLPPAACEAEEKALNDCVNGGDTSCICSAGVGVGDGVNNCSRKTTCGLVEYTQTCQKLGDGQPWTCSCFANGGLLGTCSEADEFEHCSNQYGCCVPLFCSSSSE
ncbi:MAG: hypothetical protein R3B70_43980 [Polyangiaceae bacterium]